MNAIDTNVLIYALDVTEPVKSQQATALLQHLKGSSLVIPWQVAVEFLACLRKWENAGRISRFNTESYLQNFLLPLPVKVPQVGILSAALQLSSQFSLSHYDSLLIAACAELGVDTLYSEDLGHNTSYGSVRVVNPF
jgi:predicted nucleic acid-binding protein